MFEFVSGVVHQLGGSAWGSALSFFAGLWLGYRLDLNKARRVEFNAAALPLRQALVQAGQRQPRGHARVDVTLMNEVEQRLPAWQRRGLRRAWKAYDEAWAKGQHQDPAGQVMFAGDTTALDAAAARALRYLAVR